MLTHSFSFHRANSGHLFCFSGYLSQAIAMPHSLTLSCMRCALFASFLCTVWRTRHYLIHKAAHLTKMEAVGRNTKQNIEIKRVENVKPKVNICDVFGLTMKSNITSNCHRLKINSLAQICLHHGSDDVVSNLIRRNGYFEGTILETVQQL